MELNVKNKKVLIDEGDYNKVIEHNWCLNNSGYAWRTTKKREKDVYTSSHVLLHRFILGITDRNVIVDHANGDKLDNRRENLRIVSRSQNHMNSTTNRANNTTGYKGVYYRKDRGRFTAYVEKNGKRTWLGCYDSAEEAAHAYNEKAAELFGEYARLNEV